MIVAVWAATQQAFAMGIPSLSLNASRDLQSLVVGDEIILRVLLGSLNEQNQAVLALGADVLVPSTQFSLVAGPMPAEIVPDTSGFAGTELSTTTQLVLTAFYDDGAGNLPPIKQNGTFYNLILKADSEGSGEITFDLDAPPQILGEDASLGTPLINIVAGPALQYRIRAVPEPSSVLVTLLSTIAILTNRQPMRSPRTI